MAALTMTPPLRQPFASLDAPRMRSLLKAKMNLKNQHDGALLSGKRQPLSVMDAENIDPATRLTKRKRGSDEEDSDIIKGPSKPIKASRMALTTIGSPSTPRTPNTSLKTPRSTITTPKPVRRPAGRSPPPKSCKPSPARRSTITKARAATTGPASRSVKRPFSIATALSGGKPKTPAPTTKTPTPAAWSFDIYVDSEQEEMTNLMQHSTCVLDISDDESKSVAADAGRGKENIPPAELGIALPRAAHPETESVAAAARKTPMLEESRAPLGELATSDFYGTDCHAFSYAVVYDEDEDAAVDSKNAPAVAPHHPPRSKLSSVSSIAAILEETAPVKDAPSQDLTPSEPEAPEIEIWESASAADENAETDKEDE